MTRNISKKYLKHIQSLFRNRKTREIANKYIEMDENGLFLKLKYFSNIIEYLIML